ncbi:MAG: hypothetical protein NTU88_04720 [Armatimonadetes bacterium]|nr:hypothetical protein [Armatimonadota bacterium]
MTEFAYLELYGPAHFGNSYEVMASYQMKETLQEAKFWGFNAYGDWLDAADLKDPHNNPRSEFLLPQALWDRKLQSYAIAQQLGFMTDLVVTPNHVYLDQLAPDLLADRSGGRIQGQLICPSQPRAREIILGNHRNLFKDLHARGVKLSSISGCPYDYGGCNCPSCRPWIVTFGKLMVEIVKIGREFFPEMKARLIGWWWTPDEHKLFKEWADHESSGTFVSLAAHLPYGETRPNPAIVLPQECELHAFVHIGYAEKAQPRDVYGPWGPVIAPNRLATTCYELKGIGCKGYMAYSEGHCDDLNKALLAGLSSGKAADAQSILAAYAERYFGAKGRRMSEWARWLSRWGEPFAVDTKAAREEFDRLAKDAKLGWRLSQWEAKLRIFEANAEVLERKEWDEKRLDAADRFFLARDKMYREVWGLGLVRHVLNPRYHRPAWYAEWSKQPPAPTANPEA